VDRLTPVGELTTVPFQVGHDPGVIDLRALLRP
jgi:hypothetical protein